MVGKIRRLLQHATTGSFQVQRAISQADRSRLAEAIARAERGTSAELRLVVEGALDLRDVLRGMTARERAIAVFSAERIWDTEQNNGVLLYLLVAEHDAEIVADRGLNDKISSHEWTEVCRALESDVKGRGLVPALIATIERVSELLARAYPSTASSPELPDDVIVR